MRLTPNDVQTLFTRFRSVFGTFGAPGLKDNPSLFVQEWFQQLQPFGGEEVTKGAEQWIGSNKDKWPTPGQFKALLYQSRGDRNQEKVTTDRSFFDEDTCPCGCRWVWAEVGTWKPQGNEYDNTPIIRRVQTCRMTRERLKVSDD